MSKPPIGDNDRLTERDLEIIRADVYAAYARQYGHFWPRWLRAAFKRWTRR